MKRPVLLFLMAVTLAACAASTTQAVNLTARDIKYDETTLEVKAGQPVKLIFNNVGTLEHDFSIMDIPVESASESSKPVGHDMGTMTDAPALHTSAPVDASSTLEFTPTKPGVYEFFCSVSGHKDAGMVGTLIVK